MNNEIYYYLLIYFMTNLFNIKDSLLNFVYLTKAMLNLN